MSTETARRPGLLGRALEVADALVTPHGLDGYVGLVAPTWSSSEILARVVSVEHPTAHSVRVTLRPNRNWRGFRSGQHTALTVEIDGIRHTRTYSITNSVHDRAQNIDLTVAAHPRGTVSRFLVDRARPGMIVGLSPAAGTFVLPEPRPARLLLISGGSGITPVLSMLRTLADERRAAVGSSGRGRAHVTFLHYARRRETMLHRDEVRSIAADHPDVRLVQVFTGEPGVGDLDGHLSTEHLERADPRWREAESYVCGPPALVEAAVQTFDDAGCVDRLHVERFVASPLATTAAAGTLRFERSDVEVANDGRPVLVQAEGAGLRPRSGCRMGICHTCTRTLRRGTVRNQVTGELTTEADVPVRICVNAPEGDVEIDL